jgi:hypothetical protein
MVAVDIGWRRLKNGCLRVAAWRDEDDNHGTVVLDERTIGALRRPETLRSVRDDLLNETLPALCDRLRSQPGLPEWLRRMTVKRREKLPTQLQAIAHIAQWRSHSRLRKLVLKWRDNRWTGDSSAYELAERWRYRDHHLWEWEAAQRNQSLRRRRDQYRNFAAWLARTYKTVVLEHFARKKCVEWPDEDEEPRTEQEEKASSWRHLASTHELAGKSASEQGAISEAVRKRGGRIVEVCPEWTTQDCPKCGHKQRWDAAVSIKRRPPCPVCTCELDQDDGACIILLSHGRECLSNPNSPRAARKRKKRNKHAREGESRWQRVKRLRDEEKARKEAARKSEDKNTES